MAVDTEMLIMIAELRVWRFGLLGGFLVGFSFCTLVVSASACIFLLF